MTDMKKNIIISVILSAICAIAPAAITQKIYLKNGSVLSGFIAHQYTDGNIEVQDNRFMAFHLGFDGRPSDCTRYRVLATYQEGWGTYNRPFDDKHHNISFLVEGEYKFTKALLRNWSVKGAYAMDFGGILGNNYGFQLTIAKTGSFSL